MCIPAGPASDTVRVEEGLLKIRYDKWTAFNGEFGHIFYGTPSSYYRLVAEYRFMGEQLTGGAGWAMRNNGLMLHAPDPKTMLLDQDFPISLEMQLLGGLGDGKPRTTANLCTRGTHVVMTRALVAADCVNSTSKTYDGDQWVRVEVEVLGGERIRHVVDGQTVLEYSKPQIGGGNVNAADPAVEVDGTPLTGASPRRPSQAAPDGRLGDRKLRQAGASPSGSACPAGPGPGRRGRLRRAAPTSPEWRGLRGRRPSWQRRRRAPWCPRCCSRSSRCAPRRPRSRTPGRP